MTMEKNENRDGENNFVIISGDLKVFDFEITTKEKSEIERDGIDGNEYLSELFFSGVKNVKVREFSRNEFKFLKTDISVYYETMTGETYPWLRNENLSLLLDDSICSPYILIVDRNRLEGAKSSAHDVFMKDVDNLMSLLQKRFDEKNSAQESLSEKYGISSIAFVFSTMTEYKISGGKKKENLDKFWADNCIEKFTDVTSYENCRQVFPDNEKKDNFFIMYNPGKFLLFDEVDKSVKIFPIALGFKEYSDINSTDKKLKEKSLRIIFN